MNKIITDWLHIGGQIGVGCFILISGYFMVEQDISAKKILKLTGEVWFYTIGIWVVWIIYNLYQNDISLIGCIKEGRFAFFPILTSHYWFVSAYIILMIISPYLNKLIFMLNHKEYRNFLVSTIMIFVVLQGGFPQIFPGISDGRLIPVFIMYFIAGYIKRFRTEKKNNAKKHFSMAIIFYILLFTSFYLITFIGVKYDNQSILSLRYFYRVLNSPFIVVICTELFIGTIESEIVYSKVINEMAGCTFGVYLIHSNRWMNGFLRKCFPIYMEHRSIYVLLYSILAVITIYVCCTIIDFVRNRTAGKLWNKILDRYLANMQTKLLNSIKIIWGKCQNSLSAFYNGKRHNI